MPLEIILDAADGEDDDYDDQLEISPLGRRHGTLRPFPGAAPRRGRERLSALGALAAVLILTLLATAIFNSHKPARPASQVITLPGVGTLVVFPLPTASSQPRLIVAGRDGNLWFTVEARIGRITPQGTITEFPLPAGVSVNGLAQAPDGTIWFTDACGQDRALEPAEWQRHRVPAAYPPGDTSPPAPIVAGPDGNLWFGAGNLIDGSPVLSPIPSEIGRITPQGIITEFPVDSPAPASLTVGPDGNLWITNLPSLGQDMIGRITPAGTVTEFPVSHLRR